MFHKYYADYTDLSYIHYKILLLIIVISIPIIVYTGRSITTGNLLFILSGILNLVYYWLFQESLTFLLSYYLIVDSTIIKAHCCLFW